MKKIESLEFEKDNPRDSSILRKTRRGLEVIIKAQEETAKEELLNKKIEKHQGDDGSEILSLSISEVGLVVNALKENAESERCRGRLSRGSIEINASGVIPRLEDFIASASPDGKFI